MFNLRLYVLVAVGVLLTYVAIIGVFAHRETMRVQENIRKYELPALGLAVANQLERTVSRYSVAGESMLSDGFVRDWILAGEQDVPGLVSYLENVRNRHGLQKASIVSDKSETYYSTDNTVVQLSPANWEHDGWYYLCRESWPQSNIDARYYLAANDTGISIEHPIWDADGGFLGVAGGSVDAGEFHRSLTSYADFSGVNLYLVGRDGRLIYTNVPAFMHSVTFVEDVWGIGFLDSLRRDRAPAGTVISHDQAKGAELLWVRYANELGAFILAERASEATVVRMRRAYVQMTVLGGILAVVLAAGVFAAMYAANRRVKRYHRQRDRSERRRRSVISSHYRLLNHAELLLREAADFMGPGLPLAEKLISSASVLNETGKTLAAFTNNLTTDVPVAPTAVDMRALLQGELLQRMTQAAMRGITLHSQLPPGPIRMYAVPELFHLAIDQLLILGIQKAPRDARIFLRVYRQEKRILEIFIPDAKIRPDAEPVQNARELCEAMQATCTCIEFPSGTVMTMEFCAPPEHYRE